MKSEPVIVERVYNAPVQKVWAALTDLEKMRQWYFADLIEFEPVIGFETRFDHNMGGSNFPHIWKVTDVVPGKKISYEWKYEGYPGNSLVTFELAEQDDKTKVTVTHANIESFMGDTYPMFVKQNFVGGWEYYIGKALKEYVKQENEG